MTAPLMPRATAVWLVENTTLTFKQIADFCELHELEVQAIADGDVSFNIIGINPLETNQLTAEEIKRCEADKRASLQANELELNVRLKNAKAKKLLSPSQRSDKPCAVLWIIKNCPEIIDSQICKLVGTTKPTIASIRNGTHHDMANIRAKNPVAIGLCTEKELETSLAFCKARAERAAAPKKAKASKSKKTAAKRPKHQLKRRHKQPVFINRPSGRFLFAEDNGRFVIYQQNLSFKRLELLLYYNYGYNILCQNGI